MILFCSPVTLSRLSKGRDSFSIRGLIGDRTKLVIANIRMPVRDGTLPFKPLTHMLVVDRRSARKSYFEKHGRYLIQPKKNPVGLDLLDGEWVVYPAVHSFIDAEETLLCHLNIDYAIPHVLRCPNREVAEEIDIYLSLKYRNRDMSDATYFRKLKHD